MKYNYCPKCDRAYLKSRLEKNICIYCSGRCDTIDVKRNGMYYLGYGIMLAGAACVFIPRMAEVPGPELFLAAGIGMVVGGSVVTVMASTAMARAAKDAALKEPEN